MSKGRKRGKQYTPSKKKSATVQLATQQNTPPVASILDVMKDGREFESILEHKKFDVDLTGELRKSMGEIQAVRGKHCIAYLSNVVNSSIKGSRSIDFSDDLPFSELVGTIPNDVTDIDVIIVTPGGLGQQVAKFVDRLRSKFDNVSFIVPNIAMSAGTIWIMSGDEIIMPQGSYIGPIDPQVPNRNGQPVPAQSILTLIQDIQLRGDEMMAKGQRPPWTDLEILRRLEGKEIGNAISASNYSIELVENYLLEYKFRSWTTRSDGSAVSDDHKKARANEIAQLLCNHAHWKSHGRGITRELAWSECKLRITHPEDIAGLERAIRRFWALLYWTFENTRLFKIFLSDYYGIFRSDTPIKQA